MKKKKLKKLLKRWQKRLRLRDWDIKIAVKRARHMTLDNVAGEILWNLHSKEAVIHILDPIDDECMTDENIEHTIVHELLHLHFAMINKLCDSPHYSTHEEQAIESIAKALLRN